MAFVKKTDTDWISYNGIRLNPSEVREYDWGSGTSGGLLRKTQYLYLHDQNSAYSQRNIVDRLTDTITFNGAGTKVAWAYTLYDQYSGGILTTGAVQHDNAYGAAFTARGNATSANHWRNSDGAILTTSFKYDDLGNVISSTDPLGHTTQFDFTDSWSNSACAPASGSARAFVTKTTDAAGHLVSKKYTSCTGQVGSTTNANGGIATFAYDSLNRPITVNLPDGGQVQHVYDDTNRWVETKNLRSPGSYAVGYSRYDQLGRIIRQEQCEDGTDACTQSIKTDTTYDALDRKAKVTNPYRTTADATYGETQFQYDALSRPTSTILQDGTSSSTAYNGNQTTVTDPAGKARRTYSDGLGRLVRVDEPSVVPAVGSSGSVTVTGSLQSVTANSTHATGTATISGTEGYVLDCSGAAAPSSDSVTSSASTDDSTVNAAPPGGGCIKEWDAGTLKLTINGLLKSANWGSTSTSATLASALAAAFNGDASSPATATVSGSVITFTTKQVGSSVNYSFTTSRVGTDFNASLSGATLTGGTTGNGQVTYDSGTVTLAIGGTEAGSADYGPTSNATASALGAALASNVNANPFGTVTAIANGATINLTSKGAGPTTNLSVTSSSTTSQPSTFSQPSFSIAPTTMAGGSDGDPSGLVNPMQTLYSYDALGNLLHVEQHGFSTDQNQWRKRDFTYNSLSQLLTATNPESGLITYTYDSVGNLSTKVSPAPNQSDANVKQTITYCYDVLDRMKAKYYGTQNCASPGASPAAPATYSYDESSVGTLAVLNGIGRRTSMADGSGSTAWSYDPTGRVKVEHRTISGTTIGLICS